MTGSQNTIDFAGQLVLITGAGRGLGRSYALGFAQRGAHVVVHDAGVNQDGTGGDTSVADAVVEEIRTAGGSASAAYENIANRQGCDDLIASVIRDHGRIDVLVSNAGIVRFIPDDQIDEQNAEEMLATNAMSSLWLTIALKPHLIAQGYGRIVYTVSGHGTSPSREPNELLLYGMGKAAVFGVMNMTAGAFGEADIHVNAISPVAATRVLRRPVTGDEYAADKVTPAVLLLGSREWTSSGTIVTAADGRFGLRRVATEHQLIPDDHEGTPETLWDHWRDTLQS